MLLAEDATLITGIKIESLFGLYTYDLPASGSFSSATILYGDNGAGKSTLLKLVFHLLSAANNKGHRKALLEAKFSKLEVTLAPNSRVSAEIKISDGERSLDLNVFKDGKKIAYWNYSPDQDSKKPNAANIPFLLEGFKLEKSASGELKLVQSVRSRTRTSPDDVPIGNGAYLRAIQKIAPRIFLLSAERRLTGDAVPTADDDSTIWRKIRFDAERLVERFSEFRQLALSEALAAAAAWLAEKAVKGNNDGSNNVHNVYIDVLKHLSSPRASGEEKKPEETPAALVERFRKIEARSVDFARYELSTQLTTKEIQGALGPGKSKFREVTIGLLVPYLRSIEGRHAGIEPVYLMIDRFVRTLNKFFVDKTISYRQSKGFTILNRKGNPLEPKQLSSGEQQLLLLFCNVLTAGESASVFMIDEPEISLNVKWQRELVQSLLEITRGSKIQFIFASHSIELLAQHKERVVKLINLAPPN